MTNGTPEETVATVLEELPNATWRVETLDRRRVLAHAAGAKEVNFVRLRPGDRVRLEPSPADPTRGRIIGKLGQGPVAHDRKVNV